MLWRIRLEKLQDSLKTSEQLALIPMNVICICLSTLDKSSTPNFSLKINQSRSHSEFQSLFGYIILGLWKNKVKYVTYLTEQ